MLLVVADLFKHTVHFGHDLAHDLGVLAECGQGGDDAVGSRVHARKEEAVEVFQLFLLRKLQCVVDLGVVDILDMEALAGKILRIFF